MSNPATIYIVDDDEIVRNYLQVVLQAAGYVVEAYASCREFIDNFQPADRACLILDLHLQDMGAWEPADFLKKANVDIPVILMTQRGDPAVQSQLSGSGTLALFEKPLDHDLLLESVNAIFQ